VEMHGRKRETRVLTEEEKLAKAEKIKKYNKFKGAILERHAKQVYDEVGDQLSAKLIALNPDFYTLFNYRKTMLQQYFQSPDKPDKAELCAKELQVIESGLLKNPKSYGAWSHRIWIIDQGTCDLERELSLCSKMLNMDSRNFHCWNYRRYVVGCIGTRSCLESELAFTTEKTNQDFSNYSAWHYRSVLIPQLFDHVPQVELDEILDQEFELVKQAFYTEPDDQSSWLYHRWLLGKVCVTGLKIPCVGMSLGISHSMIKLTAEEFEQQRESKQDQQDSQESLRARQVAVFSRELAVCEELFAIEPDCKWVLLTLALLLGGLEACEPSSPEQRKSTLERISNIFEQLCQQDRMRKDYYAHVQQQLIHMMRV